MSSLSVTDRWWLVTPGHFLEQRHPAGEFAARQAEDGRYLIYLVADDNFSVLQRTLLLQLAWRP